MSVIKHVTCGGTLVDAVVPYCAKCGKSKPSVLKDNAKTTTTQVETKKSLAPLRGKQASAPEKDEPSPGPAPKPYKPPKDYNPDAVDHTPIVSKDSARAEALFDEITKLRYSAGGMREEKEVWSQIRDIAKEAIYMAKEDGDYFCKKRTEGILHYSEEILEGNTRERIKKEV